eukprot:gene11423-310_t
MAGAVACSNIPAKRLLSPGGGDGLWFLFETHDGPNFMGTRAVAPVRRLFPTADVLYSAMNMDSDLAIFCFNSASQAGVRVPGGKGIVVKVVGSVRVNSADRHSEDKCFVADINQVQPKTSHLAKHWFHDLFTRRFACIKCVCPVIPNSINITLSQCLTSAPTPTDTLPQPTLSQYKAAGLSEQDAYNHWHAARTGQWHFEPLGPPPSEPPADQSPAASMGPAVAPAVPSSSGGVQVNSRCGSGACCPGPACASGNSCKRARKQDPSPDGLVELVPSSIQVGMPAASPLLPTGTHARVPEATVTEVQHPAPTHTAKRAASPGSSYVDQVSQPQRSPTVEAAHHSATTSLQAALPVPDTDSLEQLLVPMTQLPPVDEMGSQLSAWVDHGCDLEAGGETTDFFLAKRKMNSQRTCCPGLDF